MSIETVITIAIGSGVFVGVVDTIKRLGVPARYAHALISLIIGLVVVVYQNYIDAETQRQLMLVGSGIVSTATVVYNLIKQQEKNYDEKEAGEE